MASTLKIKIELLVECATMYALHVCTTMYVLDGLQ